MFNWFSVDEHLDYFQSFITVIATYIISYTHKYIFSINSLKYNRWVKVYVHLQFGSYAKLCSMEVVGIYTPTSNA